MFDNNLFLLQIKFPNLKQKRLQGKINVRSDAYLFYQMSSELFKPLMLNIFQLLREETPEPSLILQKTQFYQLSQGFIVIICDVCSSEEAQTQINLFCWLNQDETTV